MKKPQRLSQTIPPILGLSGPPFLTKQPSIQGALNLRRIAYLRTPLVTGNSPPPKVARSVSGCSRQCFLVLTLKRSPCCLFHGSWFKACSSIQGQRSTDDPTIKGQKEGLLQALLHRNSGAPTVHRIPPFLMRGYFQERCPQRASHPSSSGPCCARKHLSTPCSIQLSLRPGSYHPRLPCTVPNGAAGSFLIVPGTLNPLIHQVLVLEPLTGFP